jgi:CopG family transcriptional regulator, nickel-responsive regulator
MDLERISLAVEKDLIERFDALVARAGKGNRSEAIRDLIRKRLVEEEWERGRKDAVASLTLVYDHGKRELADRLVDAGHEHHHQVLATLHVHLDHDLCLEVLALRGKPADLRHIAEHLISLKGVKHGQLVTSSASV